MVIKIKNAFYHGYVWRLVLQFFLSLIVMLLVIACFVFFYIRTFEDRVLSGIHVGGHDLTGYRLEEVKTFLRDSTDQMIGEGWTFTFDTESGREQFLVSPLIVTDGVAIELADMDVDLEAERIISFGKIGNPLEKAIFSVEVFILKPDLKISNVFIDEERVMGILNDKLQLYVTKPKNASIEVRSIEPLDYTITSSSVGTVFDTNAVISQLKNDWLALRGSYIVLDDVLSYPTVMESDISAIVDRLPTVFGGGSLVLSYNDRETSRVSQWTISEDNIRRWLIVLPTESGGMRFALDRESVLDYLGAVTESKINVEAQDAKFEINEDGRVVAFQGSRPGRELDVEASYEAINNALYTRMLYDEGVTKSVELVVKVTEPNVNTADVNDLGITEVIGVGISNFKGSPTNRVKNISNAAKKLNGVVVRKGEEFSTIRYTKPYTEDGGYLPELVIKGDELKPEIGGGLCQIGTTLFRMAMNSGLEITERRNHSLVVSYYNDLTNGLPGTDATLYDPAPDFKFKNDTDYAILIQTHVDETTGELKFTLWGTNDGRKGWYDPPKVEKWSKPGDTKIIYTDKLVPGERECQHAFSGASASFTYRRTLHGREQEDRVFFSYYRPLPEICLVGKSKVPDPISSKEASDGGETILDSGVIMTEE